jgi:hypothetical protein
MPTPPSVSAPNRPTAPPVWRVSGRAVLAALTAFGWLYSCLFNLRGTPFFHSGDSSFFAVYAWRMLSGQVFLRDFHQFTPPGLDWIYLAAFRIFGAGIATLNWVTLFLGLSIALVTFLAASRICQAGVALLAGAASLVLLYGDRLDATHHWFSMMAALLAILVLSASRELPSVAVAGLLVGLAAVCTQSVGGMALVACCLAFPLERRLHPVRWSAVISRIAVLTGAAVLIWVVLSWRSIAAAGWHEYWFMQVEYPQKYVHYDHERFIPDFHRPGSHRGLITLGVHLFVYPMFILACPLTLWAAFRSRARDLMPVLLLALLGTCEMVLVLPRINWNRMDAAALPALILTIWLIGAAGRYRRLLLVSLGAGVGLVALMLPLAAQTHQGTRVRLPAGYVLFPSDADEAAWLAGHTRPGDAFLEVSNLRYYVAFQLRNPGPADLLSGAQVTRPAWVAETIDGLDRTQTQYILWTPRLGNGPADDNLEPLRVYMRQKYRRAVVFRGGDEIWERSRAGSVP